MNSKAEAIRDSSPIAKLGNALLLGAVVTTKECAILLKAVSDNFDTACRTDRCEGVDRALKTIVGVGSSVFRHLEGLIIIISASFTLSHEHPF
jgi:hypothetical protein